MTTLFAVRDSLRDHALLTSSQIAAILNLPKGTVEDMLRYWQSRGRVEAVSLSSAKSCGSSCQSGSCSSCASPAQNGALQAWRWRDQSEAPVSSVMTFHPPQHP
ncbi:FeoC-like transcriptional regulator [Acidithiobacillus thiooxidans]|uniref:FeoC-like transcriptional regulator n=1 Tax=Acidithiobacillus thiooxidans TaxID=930 RepID=UPI002859D11C|nr:FeoC-like transcriptional regulator [Acidithiobacillus thiooxidans]MDR7927015.1 FeoC-like transcriptional regulator [Acidithiobacillus thiooxidans]